MRQISIKWAIRLIGPSIFILIFLHLNLRDLWQILLLSKPFYLILAILSQILSNILKSERWRVIIALYQKLPFFYVLKTSVYGSIYASFTPARIGEGFKAPLIKNPDLNYHQIFFSIIVDRILDVLAIILTGYLGLIYLREVIKVDSYLLLSITIVLILFIILAYYLIKKLGTNQFFSSSWNKSNVIINWLYSNLNLIKDNILVFSGKPESIFRKTFLKTICINILIYFFYFIAVYFIALSIDLKVSFIFIVLSFSVVALLSLLPISISGIGTRDISLIFFFGILGISTEKAIAVSLLDLIVMHYCVTLFLFGLLNVANFLRGPYPLSHSQNNIKSKND